MDLLLVNFFTLNLFNTKSILYISNVNTEKNMCVIPLLLWQILIP